MTLSDKRNNYFELFGIITLAVIVRLIAMFIATKNSMHDVFHFILPWMQNMADNGFWAMYGPVPAAEYGVDYPPLYYSLMYLFVGRFLPSAEAAGHFAAANLIKVFPVTIELIGLVFIYKWKGAKWAQFFALCLPFIIDGAIMGQSDVAYCLLIVLFFYFYIEKNNIYWVGIIYAVMACTKLQAIFFFPIYMLALFAHNSDSKEKIKSFLLAVLTGMTIWLPWLIVNGPMQIFKIYLGSPTRKLLIAQNTGNLHFIPGISFSTMMAENEILYTAARILLHLLTILILCYVYKKTKDVLWTSFCYLFFVFFICLHQYSRYEIYSFVVLILLYLFEYDKKVDMKNLLKYGVLANTLQISIDFFKSIDFIPLYSRYNGIVLIILTTFALNLIIIKRMVATTKQLHGNITCNINS